MNWFVFAILHVVFLSLANILRRVLMKDEKSDPLASAAIYQLLGALMIFTAALLNGFSLPPIHLYPINFLASGVIWAMATYFIFKAYEHIEASEATIITTFESLVTIVLALLFLGEVFSLSKLIGTLLIIFSVVFISRTHKKLSFNKGVVYALLFSVLAGIGVTNDIFLLRFSDPLSFLSIGFLLPGIFILIVRPDTIKKARSLISTTSFKKNVVFTLFYALSSVFFCFAVRDGAQASQISPISQTSVILTVIFASLVLKERDHLLKKIICAILVTIGVFLLR